MIHNTQYRYKIGSFDCRNSKKMRTKNIKTRPHGDKAQRFKFNLVKMFLKTCLTMTILTMLVTMERNLYSVRQDERINLRQSFSLNTEQLVSQRLLQAARLRRNEGRLSQSDRKGLSKSDRHRLSQSVSELGWNDRTRTWINSDRNRLSQCLSEMRRNDRRQKWIISDRNRSSQYLSEMRRNDQRQKEIISDRSGSSQNLSELRRNEQRQKEIISDRWRRWAVNSKVRNKIIKSTNGNGTNNTIKLVNWNLGPRKWVNKTEDIEHMTLDFKPDMAIISEANLGHSTQDYEALIPGYKMIVTKDYSLGLCSRLVVLIRESIDFTVLEKVMQPDIASIWIKLSGRGVKTVIIGAVYREHHLLDRVNDTSLESQQTFRWNKFIAQWNSLEGKGEIFVAGDTNLDKLKWAQPDSINVKMVTAMKDKIETKGYYQIVVGPTRHWCDTEPSLIDQIWTKSPQKVLQCNNLLRPVADHNIIVTIIRKKGGTKGGGEVQKRQWSKLNIELLKAQMSAVDWTSLFQSTDPNLAYDTLETNIRKALDFQIPVKCFQNRK